MDDDAHDLTPAGRVQDDPVALALRRALTVPAPDPDALLAGVQARAVRHHRQRLTRRTAGVAGVAVAVAAVALGPGLATSGSHPGPTAAPTRPTSQVAPATTAGQEPDAPAPLLRTEQISGLGATAMHLESTETAVPGRPAVGGACSSAVLPVAPPGASWRADWTGTAAGTSGADPSPVSLVETVWRWGDAASAGAALDAVRAQVPACIGPGPGRRGPTVEQDAAFVWPQGGRVLALTRGDGGPTQDVQVLVATGSTVVRLEATGLTTADGGAAVDALASTVRVAVKRAVDAPAEGAPSATATPTATVPAPPPQMFTHGPDPRE